MRALTLAIAVLSAATYCPACVIIYPTVRVGRTFQVKVEHDGHPIEGLDVRVGPDLRATTDKDGIAHFRNGPPGSYLLHVDRDAGVPDGANLEISETGPADVTVPLRWPNAPLVRARSIAGKLRSSTYRPLNAELNLLDGLSGRLLRRSHTTENGEFAFDRVGPGIYFLDLKSEWVGLIAVAVDASESADPLDISVTGSDCGLMYTDLSRCDKGEAHLQRLTGRVVDPLGAVIPNVEISLMDSSAEVVERMRTRRDGRFASARSFSGTYTLTAHMPGFSLLRRTVVLEPGAPSAGGLKIELGLAGSCSSIAQE